MPDTKTNGLLIFIKNPKKGNVKTRLASTIGDEKALEVYKKLLNYTRKTVRPLQADKQLWYSQFIDENDDWDETIFDKKLQQGTTLGERMKGAFEQAFNGGGYEKVVIIGSDCAQLKTDHLKQAYKALKDNDVVIGPSKDGGYYLLGMCTFLPVVFEDKSWSTESVFNQTVADCKKHDLSHHILEELNDVDTEEDWNEVKDRF